MHANAIWSYQNHIPSRLGHLEFKPFCKSWTPNWWGCKQIQKQSKTCINSRTSMRIEDARKMMMQRTWGREPLRTSLGYFLEGLNWCCAGFVVYTLYIIPTSPRCWRYDTRTKVFAQVRISFACCDSKVPVVCSLLMQSIIVAGQMDGCLCWGHPLELCWWGHSGRGPSDS